MSRAGIGWQALKEFVVGELDQLQANHRLRRLQPVMPEIDSPSIAGSLDLTHNDYLGLRVCSRFQTSAHKSAAFLPVGAGASRLLGGEIPIFQKLETAFCQFKGCEAALYFTSGYAANEALCSVFSHPKFCFMSDELNHASIIDGMRLGNGQKRIYKHLDLEDLQTKLEQSDAEVNFVYTESIFSMDGDVAPLSELLDLCYRHRGVLVVDEAHAIGVRGKSGAGLIEEQQISPADVITVNTCGKALAVQGALIGGPHWLKDFLINRARPFIYTTAASPWLAAALIESLAYVRSMTEHRQHLQNISKLLQQGLRQQGWDIGSSQTHIIPIMMGKESLALAAESFLTSQGILIKAIRPPTVANHSCRLRLSLNAFLSTKDCHYILQCFARLKERNLC